MTNFIQFDDADDLQGYIATEVAMFVRDNMFELEKHPMDYQDHFDFIYELFIEWEKHRFDDE